MMGAGGVNNPASQQSPDYPMALSKIQVMSKEELDALLNDDEKFDDYIRSLQQVRMSHEIWNKFGNELV